MTIKTQGGKVLTKDGKVSCECCEEPECCPYSSDAVASGLISSGDLPDQIEVFFIEAFDGSRIANKSGLEYNFLVAGSQTGSIIFGQNIWKIQISDEGEISIEEPLNRQDLKCLIRDIDGAGLDGASDLFADTYAISGPISGIVTRPFPEISRCVWLGEGLRLTNFGFQWKVNGNNKSGFQNTPVGSYEGGFTVS
jgi:hypothetical protein